MRLKLGPTWKEDIGQNWLARERKYRQRAGVFLGSAQNTLCKALNDYTIRRAMAGHSGHGLMLLHDPNVTHFPPRYRYRVAVTKPLFREGC